MRWEELTGDRFAHAVQESEGVCIVPLSVIERHGHHLPLGTDMYIAREAVRRAAALEPVIVFPDFIFTQIPEARHLVGTIAIDGELMVALLDNVCREIARNGLHKIVLVNAHGGNFGLVHFFNMLQLYRPREYVVYLIDLVADMPPPDVAVPWSEPQDGHAGAGETSLILAARPDLVRMEQVPHDEEGQAQGHLRALHAAGVRTGIWWYADHPTHYQGDARHADAAAGEQLFAAMAEHIARGVRAVKADTVTKRLLDEFYAGSIAPMATSPRAAE